MVYKMKFKLFTISLFCLSLFCLSIGTSAGFEIWHECGVTEGDYRLAREKTKASTKALKEILKEINSVPGTYFIHKEFVKGKNDALLKLAKTYSEAISLYPCGGEAFIGRGICYQELAFLYAVSNKFYVLDERYDCYYFLNIGKIDVIEGCTLSPDICKDMKKMIYNVDCDASFDNGQKEVPSDGYIVEDIDVTTRTSSRGVHAVKYSFAVKSKMFTVSPEVLNETDVDVYVGITFTIYGDVEHYIEKRVELDSTDFVEKGRSVVRGETEVTGYYRDSVSGLSEIESSKWKSSAGKYKVEIRKVHRW